MMIINLFFLSIFLFSYISSIYALETTTSQNLTSSSLDSTLAPTLPPTAEKLVRLRRQPPYAIVKHYIRTVKPSKQRRRIKRPKIKYGPPKYTYSAPITFYKPMKSLSKHHYPNTLDDFQNLKFDTSDLHLPPSSYEAQAMNLDFYSDSGKQTKAPRIEYSFTSADESPSYNFGSHSNKGTSVTRAPHQKYGIPKDFEYASNFENIGSEHISSSHASFESDKNFEDTQYKTGSEHSYDEPPENSFESAPSFENSYHDPPSYDVPENPSSKYEVAHAPPIEESYEPPPTRDHGKFQTYEKKQTDYGFQNGKHSFAEPPSAPKTEIEITYSPSYEINIPPSFSDNTYKEKPGHFAEPPAYTPPEKPSTYQPEQPPSYHSEHSPSYIPPSSPGHQPPSAPSHQPASPPAHQPPSSPGHQPPSVPEHQPPSSTGYQQPSAPGHDLKSKPRHHRPSLQIHKPPSSPGYQPPSAPNYHRPSSPGHQPPSGPGRHPPRSHGYQPPSAPSHQPPSGPEHQPPSAPGHQPPSGPGHLPPSAPGHQPPSGPGHQPPSGPGHQPPSGPGHQSPSAPGHQPPSAPGPSKSNFAKHPQTGPPAHHNQQFTSETSNLHSFFEDEGVPSSQELPLTPNHKQPPYDFPKSSYEVPIYDPVPFDASNREQEFYPPQPYDDVSAENDNDSEPHAVSETIKEKKVTRNSKKPTLDISDVDTRSSSTSKRPKYTRARTMTRGGGRHSTVTPTKHILDAPELEMAFEAGKRKTLQRFNSEEPDTNESSKMHNYIPSTMETTLSTENYFSNSWNPMRIRTSTRIILPVQQQSTASLLTTRVQPSTEGYRTNNNRLRQRQREQSKNREISAYSPPSVARTRDVDGNMKHIDILSIEKSQSHSYYDGTLVPATSQPIPTTFSHRNASPTRFKMPTKLTSQSMPTKRTTKSVFETTHFKTPIFKSSENDKNDLSKLLGLGQNLPKNHKLY